MSDMVCEPLGYTVEVFVLREFVVHSGQRRIVRRLQSGYRGLASTGFPGDTEGSLPWWPP